MSWLNLNQSLNSLKGQITNFASEVLSEAPVDDSGDAAGSVKHQVEEIAEKCRKQEAEIQELKALNERLENSLQEERFSRKNGIKHEESNWYWDPPPQSKTENKEDVYKQLIQDLQKEISALKEKKIDTRTDLEDEVVRLREENKNLATNLEDLDSQHQMAMERLLMLKKELQKNFEVLKTEHDYLKRSNVELIEAQTAKKDVDSSNIEALKEELNTLYHKYQNLEKVHSLLRENAEKFQEENQELHEENFKLQEQVTKLEHELELTMKHDEQSDLVPRDRYDELLKELNDLKERRNSNHFSEDLNIDDNAKSVIENLKRDINFLKRKLSLKEVKPSDNLDNKAITHKKLNQLFSKYINFELPIDYLGEMPTVESSNVVFKLENAFKTLNMFKKEIENLESELSEKDLNAKHLQNQILDLTAENDITTSDLHQAEGELYEMKKNNDFLISEITALKNTTKLQPIIETHEDNIVKLESELADCNKINITFESKIKRIEKELGDVINEKSNLQEMVNDLKEKYLTLLKELEVCKNETKTVEEMEKITGSNQNDSLCKVSQEIVELKNNLTAANTRNEKLAIDIQIVENEKVIALKQLDDLKKEFDLKETTEQIHELQQKVEDLLKTKNMLESDKQLLKNKITELQENQENLAKHNETEMHLKSEIEKLNNTIQVMKQVELAHNERNVLTEANYSKKLLELENTIADLQNKSHNFNTVQEENKLLLEKKISLEAELVATDGKINNFEVEFDNILKSLNEKDSIIDSLNSTITKNTEEVSTLKQTLFDLEQSVAIKNAEIERLSLNLKDVSDKISTLLLTSSITNNTQLEQQELLTNSEALDNMIYNLNEKIQAFITKEKVLTNMCKELEELSAGYKRDIENKEKVIKELHQSIVELRNKEKSQDNSSHNDEYPKLLHENDTIAAELGVLKETLSVKETVISELETKIEQMKSMTVEHNNLIEKTNAEKAELINLVNLKHNESIQYHNEIQRLSQLLMQKQNESCTTCENLRLTLREKDEIIVSLNNNSTEFETLRSEVVSSKDTIKQLTDKCENLEKKLNIQLDQVKQLTAEKLQLSEQEANLSKELDRLRQHLLELEENHTLELVASEQKLTECQVRLHAVEDRAKQTSTVYTSNSIRANQEVETLRNQIKLLEKQRDDVQSKLSSAEDTKARSEAALTNLQLVLEQFQLDKDRDIDAATVKLQNKMAELLCQNEGLKNEIKILNMKLEESIAGLQAANRLGDQLESKSAQIHELKEEIRVLNTTLSASEQRYQAATSSQNHKVDKNLLKNLLLNYVTAHGGNKTQTLKIISTVLDFNQQECDKLGLSKSNDSLAQEFVKFLEKESRPTMPLPNMMHLTHNSVSRSTTPVSRKNSGLGPQPNPYEIGHKRNTSTGSNNLLFNNLDNLETSSQMSTSSVNSDNKVLTIASPIESGVNQPRNTEGAILKHVLKDM